MRRRVLSLLLPAIGVVACLWLLWSEIEASGLLGGSRSEADHAADLMAIDRDALEDDLRRRARLRGLPGIRRAAGGKGRLVGRVQLHVPDSGPQPLRGVVVQVLGIDRGDPVPYETETIEDGSFEFPSLQALVGYAVIVRHPPYRDVLLRGVTVRTDHTTDIGTILLGAPTALLGDVVDGAGRPVVGAEVQVFRDASRPDRLDLRRSLTELQAALDPLAEAETQRDGEFRLRDLPPGRYVLRVSAPGYGTMFREGVWVTADERATAVRVVLDPGAGYYGVVVDADGHGIANARVIAVVLPGPKLDRLDRVEAWTDVNGHYRLDRLVPGVRYFIEAWADGFAPTGRVLQPETIEELDFELGRAGRVEGTITDSVTGAGLYGAEVTMLAGMTNTLSPVSAVTDADGRYVLPAVSAGPVFLYSAKAPGYQAVSLDPGSARGLVVRAGAVTVIDRTLDPGATVSGRVTDSSGLPVAFATVAFVDARRRWEGEETALTDGEGNYRIAGLRPTTYEIRVTAAGYAPITDEKESRLEVRGVLQEVIKDIVLDRGASLVGTVRDPDGAPVQGARIEVTARGKRQVRESVRDLVAVTDAAGTWRVVGAPPNIEIQVTAEHDAWVRSTSAPLRLAPGEERRVDLKLGAGLEILGRVTDLTGHAVADARVRWGPIGENDDRQTRDGFRADELLGPRVVQTDAQGRFTLDRVAPGRTLLKVEKEGFSDWYRKDLQVSADEAPPFLEIEMVGEATIQGRVLDAQTQAPIADAWMYALEQKPAEDEPADPGHVRALVATQTAADGSYVLDRLPPGRFEIVVWLAVGYRAAAQNWREPTSKQRNILAGAAGVDFKLEREVLEDGSAPGR